MVRIYLVLLTLVLALSACAQSFSGRYVGRTEDGEVVLTLNQDSHGGISGTLLEDGQTSRLTGMFNGSRLTATVFLGGQKARMSGRLTGNTLTLTAATTTITLVRSGSTRHSPAAGHSTEPVAHGDAENGLRVRINGVQLSRTTLKRLARTYKLRFRSGDFWYDRRCGAWGQMGQPVSGLVAPNIDMGGKLSRSASNGNTGVIVNGRELPEAEVAALQQLGPVVRRRAWLDAKGNFGPEGGARTGNLFAAARAKQVPRRGILSTWDRTGVAVFGY